MKTLRKDEQDAYEWIDVRTPSDETPVVIRGLRKTDPPPPPDDIHVYELKDVTTHIDTERKWEWVPVMTYDEE